MQNFVGLDVHKSSIYAVAMDKDGNRIFERNLKSQPHDIDELLKLLPKNETTIAIEACSAWQYIYDYLHDSGYFDLVLANPYQVRIIANSRKKTDKNDATALADLLRTNMLPRSYAAPRDVREQRQITRHRASLTRINVEIKNKIHAILLRHGIDDIYSDIGDITRFPDKKKLVCFAGLNPSVYQSGNKCRTGHIAKQGDRNLRWILVQCANVAVRHDKYLAKFYHHLKESKNHNVAIVAVARKMLELMYTMMKYNIPYHALQNVKKAS